MIASLGMYERPETAPATNRYWAEIRMRLRQNGLAAPAELNRETPFMATWENPDLILSQTCAWPHRAGLYKRVTLVATPDYGLPMCPPGYYRSALVVRAHDPRIDLADFRTARFAYNEKTSQSGWVAPQSHVATLGFRFENIRLSGGHINSARAVAEGVADIAALDALSWELIQTYDAFSSDLRVLAWTIPTPGLPYITAKGQPAATIATAIGNAISALDPADRTTLHLKSLVAIPASAYLCQQDPNLVLCKNTRAPQASDG